MYMSSLKAMPGWLSFMKISSKLPYNVDRHGGELGGVCVYAALIYFFALATMSV